MHDLALLPVESPSLFDIVPPASTRFAWEEKIFPVSKKRRKARPTNISRIPRSTDIGLAFSGAQMQGFDLTKQGEEIAAILEAKNKKGAPLYPTAVFLIPRRATKTTSIWNVLLGRARHIPNTKIVTTAQDGIRARNRFREVLRALDRIDFEGEKSPANRLGKLRWANGDEAIEFDNGSRIWVVPPEAGAFRGEAADVMFFDEAGEYSALRSEDLLAGALPLMDTRPDGQVIIAGTPSKGRSGLLWDSIEAARNGVNGYGLVEYSIRDSESIVSYDEEQRATLNYDVITRIHPGIGTLTTIEKIRSRFEAMPLDQFEREYCCRFPFESSDSAISALAWEECSGGDTLPPRPDHVGIGFDVAPDSSVAALAMAWRDEEGIAHGELVGFRPGFDWLTSSGTQAFSKYRSRLGYDSIGANAEPANRLHRSRVALTPKNLKAMQAATARLVNDIEARRFRHYCQPDLDSSVAGAAWRMVGDGGRLLARKHSASEVSPLVALAIALQQFDERPTKQGIQIITAEGNQE